MDWFYKILFIGAITVFSLTSYFLGWLGGAKTLIVSINTLFWGKLPFEFQILITGLFIVVIIMGIRVATRE